MCGIAGFINTEATASRLDAVPRVLERLSHRGPDDSGILTFSRGSVQRHRHWPAHDDGCEAVLLHRRLSILDLTDAGWQPMSTRDGRFHIVFNGELYNYLELRQDLARLGHEFRTNSDTEVLLEALAEWGMDAMARFVGMFAFALLDVRLRKLFLVRDFFGIKPLYYTASGPVAFASELKALLEFKSISRQVNPEVTYRSLRFGLSDYGSETMFREIRQLPAAHYLEIFLDQPEGHKLKCYWSPALDEVHDLSFDEAAASLRDMFIESVRLHLRSDVPIGTALSGGIDSSSITMVVRTLEPKLQLKSFSFVADDPRISEERWIDFVAHSARAELYKVRATAQEMVRDLDRLTCVQDQLMAGSSPYAQFRVFQRAHDAGIKVMLGGQGADELLGGYRYYVAARVASLIRHRRWIEACKLLTRASRIPGTPAMGLAMRTAAYLLPPALHPIMRKYAGLDLMPAWLNQRWFEERGVKPRAIKTTSQPDVLRHTLAQELTSVSIPQLLRYEDRNSMAFSIESRVPFLTPKLANFILSLPEHYIIAPDGTSKAVFRRAMRGIVPEAVLDRKDKVGFETPERGWLAAVRPWIDRVLNSEVAAAVSPLDRSALGDEWEHVRAGRTPFRSQLWRALNLIKWTEQFGAQYN
jgi:asparagine synthase (glutamine-hydrolysing)